MPPIASPSLLDRVQERPDVEGQIRQLRRQRLKEQANTVYIQPQAIANLQARGDTRLPLMESVKQFLDSDQVVFLLLGESGAGKSTFNRELERNLWEAYKKGGAVPLHINLPAINKPEHDMIAKQLRKAEFTEPQIRELKLHRTFTLICDGYDESQQIRNLHTTNRLNQPGEWSAKMLISCRSEYIGVDYRDRFQPCDRNSRPEPGSLQEAVITPFSMDQIQEYITQYVSVHRPLWEAYEYNKALDLIPSLKELVTNPFLMSLSLEVLPRMIDPGQDLSATHITRVALYDQFIEHWLERGKKRLGEKDMGPLARAVFEGLVDEGFIQNGIDYMKRLSAAIYRKQDGHPIVMYSRHNDEGSWKTNFFSREDEQQLLREACHLVRSGNQHRFIHRSLLEYGISLAVFDPQDWKKRMGPKLTLARRGSVSSVLSCDGDPTEEVSAIVQQEPDLDSPLVWRSFTKDPSVLQFLEERVHQEPLFKQLLLDYIEQSKSDKNWRIAASNAITILVRSGMQFNGADLRGIRIPRADLSNGVLDSARLQGADLRHVDLRGAWLRRANLSNADMTGTQMGEPPCLECEEVVHSCLYSPDGKSIAIALTNRVIHVYSTSSWEEMWTIKRMCTIEDDYASQSIVYSPSGEHIAVGNSDYAVQIWNVLTGVCVHNLRGHINEVTGVAYSPQGDQVASASGDTTVRLWDVEAGRCLHTLTGHISTVNCVAYSPDGSQVASCSDDCTIWLWDVKTGECSFILCGHETLVMRVMYSPRGDQVASVDFADDKHGCTARLWNVSNAECHFSIAYPGGRAPFAFSSKGNQVASSNGYEVLLWDTETGEQLHALVGHRDEISEIVYSPQADLVASASEDRTVRLWDTETGLCLRILTGHLSGIRSVVFSPKGDRIISGSWDETVRIWDVGVRTSRRTSSGHTEGVYMVRCSPKGDQVASCSDDMTVRLWDVATGTCLHILREDAIYIQYSPRGDQIATCGFDTTARLWDIETGSCIHALYGHSGRVNKVSYSPQGNQLASCSDDCTVRIWDSGSGECLRSLSRYTGSVWDVVYSPNGSQIATCSQEILQLWDVETGVCTGALQYSGYCQEPIYSPQGDRISVIFSGKMTLWDIKNGELNHSFESDIVAFSPNGEQIASSDGSIRIELRDTRTRTCFQTLEGHQGCVTSVLYSAQGDLIVSASGDKTVCLWDAVSGQCRSVIQDFQHCVKDIAWLEAPNAKYVVAGCEDGVVWMWQVINQEDGCQVCLHWKTTTGEFDAMNTTIQNVQGLSSLNKRILKQFGAVGEPAHRPREVSGGSTVALPVMSKHKNTSDRSKEEIVDLTHDGMNLPSFKVLTKRLLDNEEGDPGLVKKRCSCGGASGREE